MWPRLKKLVPDVQLDLVGRDPVAAIQQYGVDPAVTVTGRVESMVPWYRTSRAVCAPIHIGGGSRLKVVEAWSVGRPLVATVMAVDGLNARHGVNALLTDQADAMARHLADMLLTGPVADDMRTEALFTASTYTWKELTKTLSDILRRLVPD